MPPYSKHAPNEPMKNGCHPQRIRSGKQNGSISTVSSHTSRRSCSLADPIERLASYLKNRCCKDIIIMAGAGISTASGIPDFRSPGTGLYYNTKKYNVSTPTDVFDLKYFNKNPTPFLDIIRDFIKTEKQPNSIHKFCKTLESHGLLLRMYTQNIDGLEKKSGISPTKLVEAHGTLETASCCKCFAAHSPSWTEKMILSHKIPHCRRKMCSGFVKPDVVMFGEELPKKFYLYPKDFQKCDLLIIMGTSLNVEPFSELVDAVPRKCPRVLLNRDAVGPWEDAPRRNDIFIPGDISKSIRQVAKKLGWSLGLPVDGSCSSSSESEVETEPIVKEETTWARTVRELAVERTPKPAESVSMPNSVIRKSSQQFVNKMSLLSVGSTQVAKAISRRSVSAPIPKTELKLSEQTIPTDISLNTTEEASLNANSDKTIATELSSNTESSTDKQEQPSEMTPVVDSENCKTHAERERTPESILIFRGQETKAGIIPNFSPVVPEVKDKDLDPRIVNPTSNLTQEKPSPEATDPIAKRTVLGGTVTPKQKPPSPPQGDKEKPRAPTQGDKEKPRSPQESDKEKPRSPPESEKEKIPLRILTGTLNPASVGSSLMLRDMSQVPPIPHPPNDNNTRSRTCLGSKLNNNTRDSTNNTRDKPNDFPERKSAPPGPNRVESRKTLKGISRKPVQGKLLYSSKRFAELKKGKSNPATKSSRPQGMTRRKASKNQIGKTLLTTPEYKERRSFSNLLGSGTSDVFKKEFSDFLSSAKAENIMMSRCSKSKSLKRQYRSHGEGGVGGVGGGCVGRSDQGSVSPFTAYKQSRDIVATKLHRSSAGKDDFGFSPWRLAPETHSSKMTDLKQLEGSKSRNEVILQTRPIVKVNRRNFKWKEGN